MKKIMIVLLLSLLFTASASEQNLLMNMQKANKALEQMIKGKCTNGKEIAKKFLLKADFELSKLIAKNESSELESSLHTLWQLNKNKDYTLNEIDVIHAESSIIAQKNKLTKDSTLWFNEVQKLCYKAK